MTNILHTARIEMSEFSEVVGTSLAIFQNSLERFGKLGYMENLMH